MTKRPTDQILAAKEVCKLMGVSRDTVMRWAKSGELPSWQIPCSSRPEYTERRFRRQDVYNWLRVYGVPAYGKVELRICAVMLLTTGIQWPNKLARLLKPECRTAKASCIFSAGMALVSEPPLVVMADHSTPEIERILEAIKDFALLTPAIVHIDNWQTSDVEQVADAVRDAIRQIKAELPEPKPKAEFKGRQRDEVGKFLPAKGGAE